MGSPVHPRYNEITKTDCGICLEPYSNGITLTAVSCGHVYHENCWEGWKDDSKSTCPSCRAELIPLISCKLIMSPTREITEALAKANVLELSNTNLAERIKQVEATNKVASEHTVQWALSEQARADTLQQQNELARIEVQNKLIAAELATQEARSQSACWENIAKTAGSETMKLRSEVMQLQHEIDRQRNRLEILNRDNTTLNRDNTTLKRDNTTLKRDNTTLKATFSEQSRCFLQIRTLVDGCKSQPSLPASEDSDLIIVGERCIDASSDDASSDDASSDDAIEPHRTAATPGKRDRTRGPGGIRKKTARRNTTGRKP